MLRAGTLQLSFDEREGMVLTEHSHGQWWAWPLATLGAVSVESNLNAKPVYYRGNENGIKVVTAGWRVSLQPSQNPHALELLLEGLEGSIKQTWLLQEQGLTVTTVIEHWDYEQSKVRPVAPGLLKSREGASPALLSIYQGILHHAGVYNDLIPPGSHGRHQLGVSGLLGRYGGIAAIVELSWEHDLYVEAPESLDDAIAYLPVKSLGIYQPSYTTHFRVCRSNVFDIAQSYRAFKIVRNEFVSWEEKIERTPGLERMFGAPHFFLGYFESQHDYLANLEEVAKAGFDRAFVYPTVFRTYQPDRPIGDEPFINLQGIHEAIKKLGFHIASWSWPEELIVGSDSEPALWALLAANASGQTLPAWAVGDVQWYTVAGQAQAQFMRWSQAHQWPELSGQHFDVTGNKVVPHLYGGTKNNVADDASFRKEMLAHAATLGPVSTEGFCDGFVEAFHCGSVMALPAWGDSDWWTIPLTSLVYHDSAMHVWWECDSYNNPHHQTQGHRNRHAVKAGGGQALEQSLLDALQGTPPNVFLCGKMYRPSDGVHFSNGATYYDISFEDEATQQALALAKPVADLHRKVGTQQIVGYDMLTSDARVQRATFRDGTTVTVNFGETSWSDGTLELDSKSWKVS
jgi:hypothetical protein